MTGRYSYTLTSHRTKSLNISISSRCGRQSFRCHTLHRPCLRLHFYVLPTRIAQGSLQWCLSYSILSPAVYCFSYTVAPLKELCQKTTTPAPKMWLRKPVRISIYIASRNRDVGTAAAELLIRRNCTRVMSVRPSDAAVPLPHRSWVACCRGSCRRSRCWVSQHLHLLTGHLRGGWSLNYSDSGSGSGLGSDLLSQRHFQMPQADTQARSSSYRSERIFSARLCRSMTHSVSSSSPIAYLVSHRKR